MTVNEAAKVLGCSTQWVYELIRDGKLILKNSNYPTVIDNLSLIDFMSTRRTRGRPRKTDLNQNEKSNRKEEN